MTEMTENKTYLCIDLKSFFASVECVERGLDPLYTNLVVADAALTEKTICLAVSPSLKKYGIGGRARLFEVVQMVKQANARRRFQAPKRLFEGSSSNARELDLHPEYQIDYIIAPPRMAKYMEYSTKIYNIYLKYVAPEDIHAYSIDNNSAQKTPAVRKNVRGMNAPITNNATIIPTGFSSGIVGFSWPDVLQNAVIRCIALLFQEKHFR